MNRARGTIRTAREGAGRPTGKMKEATRSHRPTWAFVALVACADLVHVQRTVQRKRALQGGPRAMASRHPDRRWIMDHAGGTTSTASRKANGCLKCQRRGTVSGLRG